MEEIKSILKKAGWSDELVDLFFKNDASDLTASETDDTNNFDAGDCRFSSSNRIILK